MIKYTLIFFTLLLMACSQDKQNVSASNDEFEDLVNELINKYPEYPKLRGKDTLNMRYELITRRFFPLLDSLTLEKWEFTDCGGCWPFQFIYIYDNSAKVILPLIDDYYYWKLSSDIPRNIDSLTKKFSLEKELNNALKQINNRLKRKGYEREDNELFVDLLMDLNGFRRASILDLTKMKGLAQNLNKSDFYNTNCRTKLFDNIKTIETELNDSTGNKIIYTNYVTSYILSFKQDTIELRVLGYECNRRIIW